MCLFLSLTEPETERCWLWNWRSLAQRQSCVSTVCEFCVKFVSGHPHLFFCCPCKRRYGKWISIDEKRLFRNCRVSIWYFFLYFFLTFSNKINEMRNFVFLYCVTKEIVKWRSNFKLMVEIVLAWGNRHHFETSPLVLPRSDNWRASPEFPLTFPLDLGSASSWLKICFKSNQKHCPDTGRDASLVRNLCALSRGN